MTLNRETKKECNQCGICLESCIVFKNGKASFLAELNEMSVTGAWNCVNCWKCIEICPQEVNIYALMMERRRQEDIPRIIGQTINNIIKTGCAMTLRGINQIREMYGLKPVRLIEDRELTILLE